MTKYLSRVINPEKPWLFMDDTKENIFNDLAMYTLDPVCENHGDFVVENPTWENEALARKYAGFTVIHGNFMEKSHAFAVYTDDPKLIQEFSEAIFRNKRTEKYRKARERLMRINQMLEPYGKELMHTW